MACRLSRPHNCVSLFLVIYLSIPLISSPLPSPPPPSPCLPPHFPPLSLPLRPSFLLVVVLRLWLNPNLHSGFWSSFLSFVKVEGWLGVVLSYLSILNALGPDFRVSILLCVGHFWRILTNLLCSNLYLQCIGQCLIYGMDACMDG